MMRCFGSTLIGQRVLRFAGCAVSLLVLAIAWLLLGIVAVLAARAGMSGL